MNGTRGVYSYPSEASVTELNVVHKGDFNMPGGNPFRTIFREIAIWQEALEEKTAEMNVEYDIRNQKIRTMFVRLQEEMERVKQKLQQRQIDLISILTSKDPLNQQWSIADAMRSEDPLLLDPLHVSTLQLPRLFANMFPTKPPSRSDQALFASIPSEKPTFEALPTFTLEHPSDPPETLHKTAKEVLFGIKSVQYYESRCFQIISQADALKKKYKTCTDSLNMRDDISNWEEMKSEIHEVEDNEDDMYFVSEVENPHLSSEPRKPPRNIIDDLASMYMSKRRPTVVLSMECVDSKIEYASLLADKEQMLMQWIKYFRLARNLMLSTLINTITSDIDHLIQSLYQKHHTMRGEFNIGSVQAHRDLLRDLVNQQIQTWHSTVSSLIQESNEKFIALSKAKDQLVAALWPDITLPDYAAYLMDYKAPASKYGKFKSVILENECMLMNNTSSVTPTENQRLAARAVLQPNRVDDDGTIIIDSHRAEVLDWEMGSGKSMTMDLVLLREYGRYMNYIKNNPRPVNQIDNKNVPLHALILLQKGDAIGPFLKELDKTIRGVAPYNQWILNDDPMGTSEKVYYTRKPDNVSHYAVLKFKNDFTALVHSSGRAYELSDTPGMDSKDIDSIADLQRKNAFRDVYNRDWGRDISERIRPSLFNWNSFSQSFYADAHKVAKDEDLFSSDIPLDVIAQAIEHHLESSISNSIQLALGEKHKFVLPFDSHLRRDGSFPLVVLIDEYHETLTTHKNANSKEAIISLGWSNAVHRCPDLRVVYSSGTPLPNPRYPCDLIKGLSPSQPTERFRMLVQDKRMPFWRPNLVKGMMFGKESQIQIGSQSVPLSIIFDYIDTLEDIYMKRTYDQSPQFWKETGKRLFQNDHSGLVSYITMQHDKNKFPTIVDTCPHNHFRFKENDPQAELFQSLRGKRFFINVAGILEESSAIGVKSVRVILDPRAKDFQVLRENEIPGSSFLTRMIPVFVPLNRGARTNYRRQYAASVKLLSTEQGKLPPSYTDLALSPLSTISLDRFNTLAPDNSKVSSALKTNADRFSSKIVTIREVMKHLPDQKHFIAFGNRRAIATDPIIKQLLSNEFTQPDDPLRIEYRKFMLSDIEEFLQESAGNIVPACLDLTKLDSSQKIDLLVDGLIQYWSGKLKDTSERFIVLFENLYAKKDWDVPNRTVLSRLKLLHRRYVDASEIRSQRSQEQDDRDLRIVIGIASEKRIKMLPNTIALKNGDILKMNKRGDQTRYNMIDTSDEGSNLVGGDFSVQEQNLQALGKKIAFEEDMPTDVTHILDLPDSFSRNSDQPDNSLLSLYGEAGFENKRARLVFIRDDPSDGKELRGLFRVVLENKDFDVVGTLPLKFVREATVDEIVAQQSQRNKQTKQESFNSEEVAPNDPEPEDGVSLSSSNRNVFDSDLTGKSANSSEVLETDKQYEKNMKKLIRQVEGSSSSKSQFQARNNTVRVDLEAESCDRVTFGRLFADIPQFGLDQLRQVYLNFYTKSDAQVAHAFGGEFSDVLGLSVINTLYGHLANLPSNLSTFAQTVFRVARFCGLPKVPDPADWKIRFFVYISTLPFESASSSLNIAQSSEQAIWDQYQLTQDLGANMLRALAEKAFDCPLMQDYNSDPNDPMRCSIDQGQAEIIVRQSEHGGRCILRVYRNGNLVIDETELPGVSAEFLEGMSDKILWKTKQVQGEKQFHFPAKLYYGLVDAKITNDLRFVEIAEKQFLSVSDIQILVAYLSQDLDSILDLQDDSDSSKRVQSSLSVHSSVATIITKLKSVKDKDRPSQSALKWMNQLINAKHGYAKARKDHEDSKKKLAKAIESVPGTQNAERWIYLDPTTKKKVSKEDLLMYDAKIEGDNSGNTRRSSSTESNESRQPQAGAENINAASSLLDYIPSFSSFTSSGQKHSASSKIKKKK